MTFAVESSVFQSRAATRAPPHGRTIAIIGGGFSGAALAIHLLRQQLAPRSRILLIDRNRESGRGVAYAVRDYPYLLNIPAAQMSVFPDQPSDFLEFAAARDPAARPHDFLPRALYGDYLRARLVDAVQNSLDPTQFVPVVAEVVRVHHPSRDAGSAPSPRWNVVLADGRDLLADEVVLALGNPPPRRLRELQSIAESVAYVHDPWCFSRSTIRSGERVLLLGTGLTMADVTLCLSAGEHSPAEIHALSPHALQHAVQTNFDRRAASAEERAHLMQAKGSLRGLVRTVRSLARDAIARAGDWRAVVALVRSQAPTLWEQLSDPERRRFVRHLRPYWDAHRHRLPPCVAEHLAGLRRDGVLKTHAGRLLRAEPVKNGVQVVWHARGAEHQQAAFYDRVINCTGPNYAVSASREPLVRSLLSDGLISADRLGLGIATTGAAQVIGVNGRPVAGLYCLGPWLRARFWEATAVPELRVYAASLAGVLERSAQTALNPRRYGDSAVS